MSSSLSHASLRVVSCSFENSFDSSSLGEEDEGTGKSLPCGTDLRAELQSAYTIFDLLFRENPLMLVKQI